MSLIVNVANTQDNSNIILIELTKSVYINWDNASHTIVEDELFFELKKKPNSMLLECMRDTTLTKAIICGVNSLSNEEQQVMKKGDLAFLVLDKIYDIPYYAVLEVQLDSFSCLCKHPDYLIYLLNKNRSDYVNKIRDFINNGKG
jgi:hypothetical protein